MWYVYIVKCSDKTLYTGTAKDLKARIASHNSGKGAKYTRGRTPVKVVYKESFPSRSEALKRESRIKKLNTSGKEALIKRSSSF